MKIVIELKSDLCAYSGEVYNTSVDTDVVYDTYGFPYIPAKRIKGCIREAALELKDLGLLTHYDEIFGVKGNTPSIFSLSNAKLQNYDSLVNTIKRYKQFDVCEPQKVLQLYTYTRTQTTIDSETGSAKENSLRTIRVVRKGLVFEADLDFRKKAYLEEFTNAVSIVKHMGVSRTRGLGLVNMRVVKTKDNTYPHVLFDKTKIQDNNCISYTITLKSPMICKSSMGNQAKTEEYIAGSKVLGLIAGAMPRQEYQSIMDHIIVSNAYIAYKGNRTYPGRCSLQKLKNQVYENGRMILKDMMHMEGSNPVQIDTSVQRTPANIAYITQENVVQSVDTEISYHHQRPENKAIGRATESGGSFYQLASISEGQTFKGNIYADKETANKVLRAVSSLNQVRMGYGKNSEFGQVDFVLDSVSENTEKTVKMHEFNVMLVSDVILYNEGGMLVADVKALGEYLNEYFHVNDIIIEKSFVSYATIGGFNVTWGCKKQIFTALSKGSVIRFKSATGIDVALDKSYFIGERISEGYGEMIFKDNYPENVTVYKPKEEMTVCDSEKDSDILYRLLEKELEKRMDEMVRERLSTKALLTEYAVGFDDSFKASVSKMRLVYRTAKSYEQMKNTFTSKINAVNSTAARSNNDNCLNLIELMPVTLLKELEQSIATEYKVKFMLNWSEEDKFKKLYASYITELKNKIKIGEDDE